MQVLPAGWRDCWGQGRKQRGLGGDSCNKPGQRWGGWASGLAVWRLIHGGRGEDILEPEWIEE